MFSGSRLTSGFCTMVIVLSGKTVNGDALKRFGRSPAPTPLQDKLETLANHIGYVGMAFAVATFIAMLVDWYMKGGGADKMSLLM